MDVQHKESLVVGGFVSWLTNLWQHIFTLMSPIRKKSNLSYDATTKELETLVVVPVVLLTLMSLIFVYSSSAMKGVYLASSSEMFLKKQLLISAACAIYLISCLFLKDTFWKTLPLISYLVVGFLLALVFVPGLYPEIGGAKRWLRIAGVQFQPSELAKISLVLLLAKILSAPHFRSHKFIEGVVPVALFFMIYAVLLLSQPDFGTTVLCAGVCTGVLTIAGIPKRFICGIIGTGLLGMIMMIIVAPYRWSRLIVFVDPWKQLHGGGFQIIQSYLGFQNGSLLGEGLGESKQKLFFLPEPHTDFILAVIGEELGFIGVMFIVMSYGALIFAGFRISQKQQDGFWYYLCVGITLMLSFQTIMNMGVVMGMLPTKGIPLPFISNGASSLMAYTIMISALLMANRRYPLKNPPHISCDRAGHLVRSPPPYE